MRTKKFFALWTLSALLALCLTAAAGAAMSDGDFIELCKSGTAQQVADAIKVGADVNAKTKGGLTALMMVAAHNKNPEVITALINAGADVNAKNEYGDTAIDHA